MKKNYSFILSDETVNSYGYRVLTSGINLKHFKQNPIMLYDHNSQLMPIGLWKNIRVEKAQLKADAVFDEKDKLARTVKSKVEQGILDATSIGITVQKTSKEKEHMIKGQKSATIVQSVLKEAFIATLPANKNALKLHFHNPQITLSANCSIQQLNDLLEAHLDKTEWNRYTDSRNTKVQKPSKLHIKLGVESDNEVLNLIEQKDQQIEQLSSTVETYKAKEKERKEAKMTALLNQAISERKITEAEKNNWKAMFLQDTETVKRMYKEEFGTKMPDRLIERLKEK